MTLSNSQRRYLRGRTHDIKPVVMVGDKGLTENVMLEIETALTHHELIKIRLRTDRDTRKSWTEEIAQRSQSELVHSIGQVACFYRRNPKRSVINLPQRKG